jgi:hypothetical protein
VKPGWYILNYHDVNWESSLLVRGIGGTVSPDVFLEHIRSLRAVGKIISVREGLELLHEGHVFEQPTFSFWFDDGFVGVRRYGLPILNNEGITAAISVCSRFVDRTEMFWRSKLSYLRYVDALRTL